MAPAMRQIKINRPLYREQSLILLQDRSLSITHWLSTREHSRQLHPSCLYCLMAQLLRYGEDPTLITSPCKAQGTACKWEIVSTAPITLSLGSSGTAMRQHSSRQQIRLFNKEL